MALADLGKLAMGMASELPSRTNVLMGGGTEGIAKFMDLKRVFKDAMRQMEIEEMFKKRAEEREFSKQKELKRYDLERELIRLGAIRPIDKTVPAGIEIAEGGRVGIPNRPLGPDEYIDPSTISPETYIPPDRTGELQSFPGYAMDYSQIATGQMPNVFVQNVPGIGDITYERKGGKISRVPRSNIANRPMPAEYQDIVDRVLSDPNDAEASIQLMGILPYIEAEAKKGNPNAIVLWQQISEALSSQ